MNAYQKVFENNKRWVANKQAEDPDYFKNLSREQHPSFLYIGCADSRVPANEIMGLEPGELFVHRNIANIIDNIDVNSNAVIQYAVEVLEVKHIVVCGHYGCGGVKAAMQPVDMGLMNGWLRNVRDVFRLHKEELLSLSDENARFRRLVELNVQEQCIQVIKSSWVQKSYLTKGYPTVHGWVYALEDGILHDLKIHFPKLLESIREIYRLRV